MSRITNQIRHAIAKDLLELKFKPTCEALLAENAALFELAYITHYSAEIRELIERLQSATKKRAFSLVSKFDCRTSDGLKVPIGAIRIGNDKFSVTGKAGQYPVLDSERYDSLSFSIDTEIDIRLKKFAQDQRAFADAITKARAEALAALNSINTAKQMEGVWPEALPFLEKHLLPPAKTNVPAVQFQHLNAAFGLPVEVAA